MAEFDLALNNGKLFLNNKIVSANLAIEKGKIASIKKTPLKASKEINCKGKLILAAAIDAHVHFRIPGAKQKEDWKTGSRAALHGGVATVFDMPNNSPATVSVKELAKKRKLVSKDSLVNYGLFFGASEVNEMRKAKNIPGFKLYMGSSTGVLAIDNPELQSEIFKTAFKEKKVLAVHAEDEHIIKDNSSKFAHENSAEFHSQIRSIQAEWSAVQNALDLQHSAKNKLHFCHITSAKALNEIEKAKQHTEKISCETSPNYLFFSEKDVRVKGNLLKVNPSIKTEADKSALWNGINSGIIDLIATDHAPHLLEEKEMDYWHAPSGIPGVETMLPLMLDAYGKGLLALEKIPKLLSENPARIYGAKEKGFLKEGFDADLNIIDLKKSHKIDANDLFSKSGWTPFDGLTLKGKVEKTFVNGNLLFDSDQITSRVKGQEVKF